MARRRRLLLALLPLTVAVAVWPQLGPSLSSDLINRDGSWWLHVVVSVPAPDVEPTDEVVEVDLGIAQPAVTSTNRFLGKPSWKAIEGRHFSLKR